MNYYNEHDRKAAAWLRELIKAGEIPAGDVDERNIQDVKPNELAGYNQCHFFAGIGGWALALKLAGVPDDYPLWTGSCPCQPFSAAGAGLREADERHLWPDFRNLIAERRPAIVLGEQVASKAGFEWLARVRADLERAGYACGAADLCAAGVGAPHRRQRIFWVADAQFNAGESRRIADQPAKSNGTEGAGSSIEPGRRGLSGILADADERADLGGVTQCDKPSGADGLQKHVGGMGDAHGEQADAAEPGQQMPRAGRDPLRRDAGTGGGPGSLEEGHRGLEHAKNGGRGEGARAEAETREVGREIRARPGAAGFLPDGTERPGGGGAETGSDGGHAWATFDLLPCLDGKWRRVESGTFPLAHGIQGRVGLLRGYGNAIVPQLAAEFIKAALDLK